MASPASDGEAVTTGDAVSAGFTELERQQQLLASCTRLYRQLEEHFSSLERGLNARSDSLRHKRRVAEARASRSLNELRRRELSIDGSVSRAVDHLDELAVSVGGEPCTGSIPHDAAGVAQILRALCARMDSATFFRFVVARR
ncbi:hypothetical protein GUJ93_ZPchr0016g2545 [Zizania palustris]|uniref:FRIGIDA-like protein n=1 Tax=Zizania palustris TaxID=103762 RepID=A0A8J5TI79_ZIZPA|nr:hypothetical protein GUJ93_ZPchr0016g2545 [Zizania palustris]